MKAVGARFKSLQPWLLEITGVDAKLLERDVKAIASAALRSTLWTTSRPRSPASRSCAPTERRRELPELRQTQQAGARFGGGCGKHS